MKLLANLALVRRLRKPTLSLRWPMVPATVESSSILPARDNPRSGYGLQVEYRYEAAARGRRKTGSELAAGPVLCALQPGDPADCFLDPYRDVRMPD